MHDLFAQVNTNAPFTIDQDDLAEFAAEQGWKVRTDSDAMRVHEIIYTKPIEGNSHYEFQIWTGVHRPSAPRPGKHPFRIFGYNNVLKQNRTHEEVVLHRPGWRINVPMTMARMEAKLRERWMNPKRPRMLAAGYVVTEFGQQVRY